ILCSSSSSIHSPGTRASRAAAKQAVSSGALPRATAAATRTNAAVGASSTGPIPGVIVPLPAPRSLIVSLLQSAFYTQLPYRLTPRVHVGSNGEPGRTRPETQLLEYGRQGECRSDRVSVSDLERDAESFLREEGTVHTLGADLGDHAAGVRPHDLGTGPTLTGDEIGVAQHRFHDCGLRTADWTHALRIRNPKSAIASLAYARAMFLSGSPKHTTPHPSTAVRMSPTPTSVQRLTSARQRCCTGCSSRV